MKNLLNSDASPRPWHLGKMNDEGIEVIDAVGDIVYYEDFGMFLTK